jgi:hypothetical protein
VNLVESEQPVSGRAGPAGEGCRRGEWTEDRDDPGGGKIAHHPLEIVVSLAEADDDI